LVGFERVHCGLELRGELESVLWLPRVGPVAEESGGGVWGR
jgi:hypothetical protein